MAQNEKARQISDATVYRLSLYHCLLTDWQLAGIKEPVTSRDLAESLDVNEVTVRNDLSYLGKTPGKRGVGYDIAELRKALGEKLGLTSYQPIAIVGSVKMIDAVLSIFHAERFGFIPVAFFSENPDDEGATINGQEVYPIERIPDVIPTVGAQIALIAPAPSWVQKVIDLLAETEIKGALNLTPTVAPQVPKGMRFHQRRLPCDLKSLIFRVSTSCELNDKGFCTELMGVTAER